jgi:Tfp pilus assembly protein PilO
MNYAQKALLVILVLFALLGAFILGVYLPGSARLEEKIRQSERLEREVRELEARRLGLDRVREQVEVLSLQLSKIEEQYPRAIDPVYRSLSEAARKRQITVLGMRAIEQVSQPDPEIVRLWDIAMEVRSEYDDFGEFLADVSGLPVLVRIAGLHLERGVGEEGKDQVEVSLNLTAYLSRGSDSIAKE